MTRLSTALCSLLLLLPIGALADARLQTGFTANAIRSADYRFAYDDSEGNANLYEVAAVWPVRSGILLNARGRYTDAVMGPWNSGHVEEWRLSAGVASRYSATRSARVGFGADLIVANVDALLPDRDSMCLFEPGCPMTGLSETDWGAEVSAAIDLQPTRAFGLFASVGYQVLGEDEGTVMSAGVTFATSDNLSLHVTWFDEPRVRGFGAGVLVRFGR